MTRRDCLLLRLVALLGLCGAACGTQFADPISLGTAVDPCLAWTTAEQCAADTAHGCTVQPNAVGCLTTDENCAAQSCRGGDPFVRRSGRALRLHDAPYQFLGVNSWGIAWDPSPNGCRIFEFSSQDGALVRMFDDLVKLQGSVARIWAFQPYAGPSGTDYSRFDNLVGYARRANVRLIFVLENGRKDNCSRGEQRDDAWFESGYLSAYDQNQLSYPDYVRGLVKHFYDEPTILAWELMHEAGTSDFAALDGFVSAMSALIRSNDPNHLISVGVDTGIDGTATSRTDAVPSSYFKLHEHATVDLVDVHDFLTLDAAATIPGASATSPEAIARSLNKPIFLGALAIPIADADAATLKQRADGMKTQIDGAFSRGFAGTLLYDYYPDWQPPATNATTYSFDARTTDPLGAPNGVVVTAAQRYELP